MTGWGRCKSPRWCTHGRSGQIERCPPGGWWGVPPTPFIIAIYYNYNGVGLYILVIARRVPCYILIAVVNRKCGYYIITIARRSGPYLFIYIAAIPNRHPLYILLLNASVQLNHYIYIVVKRRRSAQARVPLGGVSCACVPACCACGRFPLRLLAVTSGACTTVVVHVVGAAL